MRKNLVNNRFGPNDIMAIHQVMTLGSKSMIDCLVNKFGADLSSLTAKDQSVMHCAAQACTGYTSILILVKQYGMNTNCYDRYRATPLHLAILQMEFHNIELLLNFDADVNSQDHQGNSPLHFAVTLMLQRMEYFDRYKKIIKELLFHGADRSLTR